MGGRSQLNLNSDTQYHSRDRAAPREEGTNSPLPGCANKGWRPAREATTAGEYTTSLCSPALAFQDKGSSKDILIALELSPGLERGWLQG